MKVQLLSSAIEDLEQGRTFYEAQGGFEVGDYFLDSLFSEIDSLSVYSGFHRQVNTFHRLLARRFPFSIYYKIEGQVVIVYRVLDNRQNPKTNLKKLKD